MRNKPTDEEVIFFGVIPFYIDRLFRKVKAALGIKEQA